MKSIYCRLFCLFVVLNLLRISTLDLKYFQPFRKSNCKKNRAALDSLRSSFLTLFTVPHTKAVRRPWKLTDFFKLSVTVLKKYLPKHKPKVINYRNYQNLQKDKIKVEFDNEITWKLTDFFKLSVTVLKKYLPKHKPKVINYRNYQNLQKDKIKVEFDNEITWYLIQITQNIGIFFIYLQRS